MPDQKNLHELPNILSASAVVMVETIAGLTIEAVTKALVVVAMMAAVASADATTDEALTVARMVE